MKGLAVDIPCPRRHFTLWGRRLTGRFSRDTDLKHQSQKQTELGLFHMLSK